VVRNRVKRRLRHFVAPRLDQLRADVVIRALPPAAADPGRLAGDLASAWEWAVGVAAKATAAPDLGASGSTGLRSAA